MKTLALLFFLTGSYVCSGQSNIPDKIQKIIRYHLGAEIHRFKYNLCPEIETKDVKINPYDILYPDLRCCYHLNFKIKKWPEEKPFKDFFLIIKENNFMSRLSDTVKADNKCNKYFSFDERFLVYYDSSKNEFYNLSGNIYQAPITMAFDYNSDSYIAFRSAQARTVQYNTSGVRQLNETESYWEFSAARSNISSTKILIRILKAKDRFNVGSSFDLIFYSQDPKRIPNYEKGAIYEVKYSRSLKPKNLESLEPKFRKLDEAEKVNATRVLVQFLEFASEGK